MNADVQLNLALILFLPWYAILGGLYWWYPRQPRTLVRWAFDVCALAVTTAAAVVGMHLAHRNADVSVGPMWKQILATSVSYGVFLAAMTVAFLVRRVFVVRPFLHRNPQVTQ